MIWRQVLREALASLRFYRRRTVVTVSSLAWGVASFVMLMSYGDGFDRALRGAFTAVGQNLVVMAEGQTSRQAGGLRAGRRVRLERDDAEAIRAAVPAVRAISPELMRNNMTVTRGTREKQYGIRAVWPEYQHIRNMTIVGGRWINPEDILHRNRVAVLGATAARELFSGIPPVGEEIVVAGLRFTVIGVLDTKAQIANYNRRDNECIFIPYESMGLFADTRYPTFIVWTPVSGLEVDKAIRAVRATLGALHKFSPADDQAVFILAFSQFMYLIDGMSLALKLLLGCVGALTLGIGGVGLANIMLAAVMDRTREIGVLKALGSPRRAILGQFLAEGLLIVAAGGVLGILAGAAATYALGSMPLLGALFQDAPDKGNVEMHVSAASVLVSIGVLLAVGLTAGMIPAIRASRLDPIEALRYE
ncbi:MAG: ABC transporter permease [Bryobacterales bacterium]|nr:ABC transporter permease [Bryobacterales bacterium]